MSERQQTPSLRIPVACLVVAAIAVGASSAEGQELPPAQGLAGGDDGFSDATYVSLGYTVNAPEQMFGVAASTVGTLWGGWGLYVDAKRSTEDPDGEDTFDPTRTAADVAAEDPADELFGEQSKWRSLNGALVRKLGDRFAVYAGGGVTQETAYEEYQNDDPTGPDDTFYWVEDETESETGLNLLGGGLFRATRNLLFHFGGEANPAGLTVGASLGLPLGG